MLSVKLRYLDQQTVHRREIARTYLAEVDNPLIHLPAWENEEQHVWHLFVVRTQRRRELQEHLQAAGVQTLVHYPIPPHKQESYRDYSSLSLPLTEAMHEEVLSLPMGPSLTLDEVRVVIEALNSFK
ncbi:dTDP-3-amino-3,6-dideoxy-alpha-D-galactopyranose transaminase [compost metagenome]